jgi:hypothetical protein
MWEWLERQWNDVKGNVKFWLLGIGITAAVTAATWITHDLALWQHIVLAASVVTLFGWAVMGITAWRSTRVVLSRVDQFPEPAMGRTYNMKVRVVFRNDARQCIDVKGLKWKRERLDDVPIQEPLGYSFQVAKSRPSHSDGGDGWQIEDNEAHVRPGERFRVWVGLSYDNTADDIRMRIERDLLGTMELLVWVSGKSTDIKVRVRAH